MCAISGLITQGDLDRDNFKAMTVAAAHRGPDDEGFFFADGIALGHRRLAIIDLTSAGHQPMEKDGLQIVYNGEIYNYKELRDELRGLGHKFVSESDTEVILAAYREWGGACVPRFNGMWSLAIYDTAKKTLFCSRDRFGIKPFYFYHGGDFFAFGSEIRQILACRRVRAKLNRQTVAKYLISSVVDDSDETFFEGIQKLRPGHNLLLNTTSLRADFSSYYDVRRSNTTLGPGDLRETLADAVRLRLRADTPVGSCLSGGLDSSLVVSLASRGAVQGKFQTFTSIPFDKKFDESGYVRKLATDLRIETHFTTPQKSDFHSALGEVITLQEEPFLSPSIFMQYFVMKKARETGLKVLLDGQGADEIFLGYEKYFPAMITKMAVHNPLGAMKMLKDLVSKNDNVSLPFLLKVKAKGYMAVAMSPQIRALKKVTRGEFTADDSYATLNLDARNYEKYRYEDIVHANLPGLLRYEDKNSMHFGIETRLPYLDYRVVDIALKTPVEDLIVGGLAKAPLRTQFDGVLPEYIAHRRSKFNFNAPADLWSTEAAKILAASPSREYFFKDDLNFSELNGIQPWKVLNLCLWHDHYFISSKS